MTWLLSIVISIVCFSIVNALSRLYVGKIHPILALVPQVISSLIIILVIAFVYKQNSKNLLLTHEGIIIAIVAGIIWIVGQLLFCISLNQHAPLIIAVLLSVGGVAIGGIIVGVGFFHEQLSLIRIIGIITVLIGSIFLAV